MWHIADQESIRELNESINDLWNLLAYWESLSRWNGTQRDDVLQLREITERISENLNMAILWEQFA